MKKVITCIVTIILLAACSEDKGTYGYKLLNEVRITGIQEAYEIIDGDPFSITPEIEQAYDKDESILKYMWYIYDASTAQGSADTLSHTKNLQIETLVREAKTYKLVFKVTDTSTGIFYTYNANLTIKGFTDGLYVLSNNNDEAQVAILRGTAEGVSSFNAYKTRNNEIAGTNPVSISGINKYMKYGKPYRFILLCNDETFGVYAGGGDFKKTINIKEAFTDITGTPPANVTGTLGKLNTSNSAAGVFGDSKLYTTFQPGGIFGEECAMSYSFDSISPHFKAFTGMGYVLYNTGTKGFGLTDNWGTKITFYPATTGPEDAFDISNTGLDVIYGKTVGDYRMGVFVDSVGQKYILALNGIAPGFKKELNSENINNATIFEFLNQKEILYYAYKNVIYTYDVTAEKVLYSYEIPKEAVVDYMEISQEDTKLYVGFSDGSNATNAGSVHILNIDLDGEILDVYEAYENKFGRVVDFFENN